MGIIIALIIILLWLINLFFALNYIPARFTNMWTYIFALFQTYLYTGLFITAHDAMHKTISKNKFINDWIGRITSFLYAAMSYKKLLKNHIAHHKHPGEEKDPDFNVKTQNFFLWYLTFFYRYATIWQFIIMGAIFNLLKYFYPVESVIAYWIIPSFLSSVQLFYFGTYKPHMKPHLDEMKPHNARSLKLNHLWSLISCYFFGYHWEHHEKPYVPWWKLWKVKEERLINIQS